MRILVQIIENSSSFQALTLSSPSPLTSNALEIGSVISLLYSSFPLSPDALKVDLAISPSSLLSALSLSESEPDYTSSSLSSSYRLWWLKLPMVSFGSASGSASGPHSGLGFGSGSGSAGSSESFRPFRVFFSRCRRRTATSMTMKRREDHINPPVSYARYWLPSTVSTRWSGLGLWHCL